MASAAFALAPAVQHGPFARQSSSPLRTSGFVAAPSLACAPKATRFLSNTGVIKMTDKKMPEKEPYPGYFRDVEKFSGAKNAPAPKKIGGKASLLRPDGTPYAPWMRDIPEEASEFVLVKSKSDARGKLAGDPQQQELAGLGLKAKIVDSDVVLSWSTGKEIRNIGFIVQRRRGGSAGSDESKPLQFTVLDDYQSNPSALKSKGAAGGEYQYVVKGGAALEEGTWVYRISDVSENGTISDLSQTLVEIQSASSQRTQVIALAALVIGAAVLYFIGTALDPMSGL